MDVVLVMNKAGFMTTPIIFALVGMITAGLISFLWQVAGTDKLYLPSWMLIQSSTVAIGSIAVHLWQRNAFDLPPRMVGLAATTGIIALISVAATLYAIRMGGPGSIVFPLLSLGVVTAVPLSFIVFHEPITTSKLIGLALGIGSIVMLTR